MVSELELRKQGITFRHTPEGVTPFGPRDREDLRALLAGEIERRASLMAKPVRDARSLGGSVPLIVIGSLVGKRSGECISCGDELEPHRGGQCWLCIAALQKALARRMLA